MDNTLQHHGILGMRWGVRRYQNADGTLTEAGKKRYGNTGEVTQNSGQGSSKFDSSSNNSAKVTSNDVKTKTPKNAKSMTDVELKAAIDRIRLEQDYNKLVSSSEGKATIEKGKTATTGILSNVGSKIATTALTGAGLYTISAIAGGRWDREKFGDAIFNGGAKKK